MTFGVRHARGEPSLFLAEGDGTGPPLLLLHGVTRMHGDWSPLLGRLGASWRVIALDQRGHGRSGRAGRYLVVDYVADAVRIIREEVGEPVTILGHSLGAMVAAGVAAEEADLVRAVVLEDPPFHAMGSLIEGSAWQAQFLGMREIARRGGTVESLALALAGILLPRPGGGTIRLGDVRSPDAIRWSAECLAGLDPDLLTPVIEGRWLDGYDPVAIARAIRCPVRLLQADPAAGGALSDDACAAFADASVECTVERFSGVGHQIHQTLPERVCDAVDAIAADAHGSTRVSQEAAR
jgi:pimeloyl-ACP methyl ester carboxylesterase